MLRGKKLYRFEPFYSPGTIFSSRPNHSDNAGHTDGCADQGTRAGAFAFKEHGKGDDDQGRGGDDGQDDSGGSCFQGPLHSADAECLPGEAVGQDPRPNEAPFVRG